MRGAVLLAAPARPGAYAALVEAMAAAGRRVGWLELGSPAPLPATLEEASAAGVLRAVAAGRWRVASVKPVAGGPVLRDLIREHFPGCRLVLVQGGRRLPRLEPDGAGWRLTRRDGSSVRWSTAELVRALGRPSVWRDGRSGAGGADRPARGPDEPAVD